jgi:hypothetical protein
VKLQLAVDKDFGEVHTTLRHFFHDIHKVHTEEICPCPLGDAYVRFYSVLDRERFLGSVFHFGQYSMTVVKHDESDNAHSFDLDREAWVMLVGFSKDLKKFCQHC